VPLRKKFVAIQTRNLITKPGNLMKTVRAITTVSQCFIWAAASSIGFAREASGAEPKPPRLCDYVRPLVGTSRTQPGKWAVNPGGPD
jgi:hypothetical protein